MALFCSFINTWTNVQLLSCVRLFVTPWTAVHQASLSFTIFWSLLKFPSTESVMPFNHVILCHLLLLLPSVFHIIRVFSNESAPRIGLPRYWSFCFSISPSNEYSRLISFSIDWFDFLEVQETLMHLFQHHNLKASVLWHSAGIQPGLIQGVRSGDGGGEDQDTIASIRY